MKRHSVNVLLASMVLAAIPVGAATAEERFACNMNALTKHERAAYAKLTKTLRASVEAQKELPNGYAFRVPPGEWMTVAEWVSFERKCCPFFAFDLELEREGGPLWLRVTGAKGVKEFIRAEFELE